MKKSLVTSVPGKKMDSSTKEKIRLAAEWLPMQPARARHLLEELIEKDEGNPLLWVLMSKAHQRLETLIEAENCLNKALKIAPYYIEAVHAKADLLYSSGRLEEACRDLNEAVSYSNECNDSTQICELLARILWKLKKYDLAGEVYQKLVNKEPKNWAHWNNLGMVKLSLSQFDEMDTIYSKSATLTQDSPIPYFNRIVGLHYHPEKTAEQILALCKAWQNQFRPKVISRAAAKNKTMNKRLRIGLISDGLRVHPVGNMITVGLAQVSESQFEFYAYSTNDKEDHITHRIKRICAKWHIVKYMNAEELDSLIREDEIDILFDLNGYNENSRMQTMLMAPAPVQIKWVGGLISSTGLETMDYLLSDNIETPEEADALYTEKLIRMPDDYICYDPPFYLPPVSAAPVNSKGYITFGCFNNASKINDVLLAQWAALLHQVPYSRLFLKSFNFESEPLREQVLSKLEMEGISRERVRIEGSSPHRELLASYNDVDIALDPWPYSGGLTTCEALAMGVPVVTLPGPTFAGRHSASHLVNAGLQELIAGDWEQYINICVGITQDLDSLNIIRSNLRDILLASPVCDGQRFAKHFTDAMRAIWQRYCEGKQPEALTLSNDAPPYFHDDRQAVELQYAPEQGSAAGSQNVNDFQFQMEGKIFMMDYGGSFVTGNKFIYLADLDTFYFIIMDVVGSVAENKFPLRRKNIQHIQMHALGDGKPVPVYICLDNVYSSDLKPLGAVENISGVISDKQIVTEILAQSSKLDAIHGLDSLEWLVLDNKFDIAQVFKYGQRLLSECLVIDIRLPFSDTHEEQLALNDISAALKALGFYFHAFQDFEFAQVSTKKNQVALSSSQMVAARGLWLPNADRLAAMSEGQREKLAFIMHAVYDLKDVVYSTLEVTSLERAEHYLISLKGKEGAREATSSDIIPDNPRMTARETSLFESYLQRSKAYYEFGSGGSTKLATRHNVEVYGVESDKFWVDTLKKEVGPLCKVDYVNIGPTKEWGYPVNDDNRDKFPRYSQAIMQHDKAFDLILVDGRFRVACTLNAIRQTLAQQKNIDDTIIFIHDFWNRPDYHPVLTFLDMQEKVESAGAFKIKPEIDVEELMKMLDKYQYVAF